MLLLYVNICPIYVQSWIYRIGHLLREICTFQVFVFAERHDTQYNDIQHNGSQHNDKNWHLDVGYCLCCIYILLSDYYAE